MAGAAPVVLLLMFAPALAQVEVLAGGAFLAGPTASTRGRISPPFAELRSGSLGDAVGYGGEAAGGGDGSSQDRKPQSSIRVSGVKVAVALTGLVFAVIAAYQCLIPQDASDLAVFEEFKEVSSTDLDVFREFQRRCCAEYREHFVYSSHRVGGKCMPGNLPKVVFKKNADVGAVSSFSLTVKSTWAIGLASRAFPELRTLLGPTLVSSDAIKDGDGMKQLEIPDGSVLSIFRRCLTRREDPKNPGTILASDPVDFVIYGDVALFHSQSVNPDGTMGTLAAGVYAREGAYFDRGVHLAQLRAKVEAALEAGPSSETGGDPVSDKQILEEVLEVLNLERDEYSVNYPERWKAWNVKQAQKGGTSIELV